jgi:hypothetical protein
LISHSNMKESCSTIVIVCSHGGYIVISNKVLKLTPYALQIYNRMKILEYSIVINKKKIEFKLTKYGLLTVSSESRTKNVATEFSVIKRL